MFQAFDGVDPEEAGALMRRECPQLIESKQMKVIRKKWNTDTAKKENRVEATFEKEKALESIELIENFGWNEIWNCPPFLIPKTEKDAVIINDILIKSWETQGSACLKLPQLYPPDDILTARYAFKIHGYLKYYFSNIPSKIF